MKRLIGIAAALAILALTVPAAAQPRSGIGRLSRHDQGLLTSARAAGQGEVTLLVAADPGAHAALTRRIAALGGKVGYSDETLGYLRVRIATGKAEAVARLPGAAAVSVDEIIPLDDPRPEAPAEAVAVTPPGPSTPAVNPYLPAGDIGAPQFVAAHPTYDGRGVIIGILDTGIDLLTPELKMARLLDGTPTRKIIDWVTFTDPNFDDDPTWVSMADQVTAAGGTLTYQGETYTAPRDGLYRIGLFDERDYRLDGELANDVNRDGNPAGSSGLFAVLWDTGADAVWVDANQDHSFADEPAMRNYREGYDVGQFGSDDPDTALRETVPFVVQTDGRNRAVNIGIVSGAHGTHVAGIAAGQGFFGGAFDGAAPAARIVSVRVCLFISGCTAHALLEGMIYAVRQGHADVINMSIGGLPALNDGNNARAVLYNRLIDRYGAQMFISAGNSGPGINTAGDPSVATQVMSVGAYVSRETWLGNYGALADRADGLFVFSSRGPREDGGFKPNLVAPGAAVSSIPLWQENFPLVGPLPPGYDMFNGTSMAAPEATGGAALLISAAKQARVPYKPDQLRQALVSSARYLPGYAAHEQGNGLMQVGAAWEVLRQKPKTVSIHSQAPVRTILSDYLATPGMGPGLYEREGWHPGDRGQRTLLFTRLTGPNRPVTYQLNWRGNDGTFSGLPASVRLELGMPVALPVTVNPVTGGAHSAILNLDDPATPGIDYQTLNTVVAALPLTTAGNFAASAGGQADRPDKATFFFDVPEGVPALKLDLTGVSGRVRMLAFHPWGIPAGTALYQTGGVQNRVLANPAPGVWEVTVDTSRVSDVSPASFDLTASLLGVAIVPAVWRPDGLSVGSAATQEFVFTNRFGAFTGNATGSSLGSAFRTRPSIGGGDQQVRSIVVPSGSTSLTVRLSNPADPGADLDLYLFDCTGAECILVGASAGSTSDEVVAYSNPTPGQWYAVIVGYAVPAGTTAYDYLDLYANPSYGSVSLSDPAAVHGSGTSWSATASVTAAQAPEAGRFLRGFVQVRAGGAVIGTAAVELTGVTP